MSISLPAKVWLGCLVDGRHVRCCCTCNYPVDNTIFFSITAACDRVEAVRYSSLHFAWVVDDAKCIVVTRVCLCLFAAAWPHYCMNPNVTWGMIGVPPIDGTNRRICNRCNRVALLWQHSAKAKCQRVLVLALCLVPLLDKRVGGRWNYVNVITITR